MLSRSTFKVIQMRDLPPHTDGKWHDLKSDIGNPRINLEADLAEFSKGQGSEYRLIHRTIIDSEQPLEL